MQAERQTYASTQIRIHTKMTQGRKIWRGETMDCSVRPVWCQPPANILYQNGCSQQGSGVVRSHTTRGEIQNLINIGTNAFCPWSTINKTVFFSGCTRWQSTPARLSKNPEYDMWHINQVWDKKKNIFEMPLKLSQHVTGKEYTEVDWK